MERDMSLPSLEPMIGRVVKVYKGGPESRVGKLLAVNDDHLVLQSEQDGVLYYYLRHIKSIAEDTKEISDSSNLEEEVEYLNHSSMEYVLEDMMGKNIRIDRGGPESRSGKLLACTYDHMALETKEDGVLYSRLYHIKSISMEENENAENGANANAEANAEAEERTVEFFNEDGFDELLDAVKYRWIKINRGGPESIEGVLVDSSGDHLILVIQQEVSRIPTWHIRNISVATKKAEEKSEENNSEQNNKNDSSKLSSDDISYIEKMLSEKYKSRGSDHGEKRGSKRSSSKRSNRGSKRSSGKRSNRGSKRSSGRRSSRGSRRSSGSRSSRRSRRSSGRRSHRSDRRSDRRSGRRSNRREKTRSSNRREKKRSSNRRENLKSSKKKRTKKNGTRLTFFTR